MAEPAPKLMSVTEFLAWDDGTDRVHELVHGAPVAMAPGSKWHVQIAQNISRIIDRAVEHRRPCRVVQQGGIRLHEGPPGNCYIPVVLMTCESIERGPLFEAPRLVVEVLPPSTASYDKRFKLPDYAALPSTEEIWLVDSRLRCMLVFERLESGWHSGLPLIGRAVFTSRVLAAEVSLDAVYELTSLEAEPKVPTIPLPDSEPTA